MVYVIKGPTPDFPTFEWTYSLGSAKLTPPPTWEGVSKKGFWADYTVHIQWNNGAVTTFGKTLQVNMPRKHIKKEIGKLVNSREFMEFKMENEEGRIENELQKRMDEDEEFDS